MKIIGLTGGIGSGKSTVLEMFKEMGFETYIADIEAKKIMNTNEELVSQIKALFGENAYEENELNRKYIATQVFENKEKLAQLNALVHPKVKEHFQNFVKNSKADCLVYESAILFESKSYKNCDYIINVTANFDDKIERIKKRDNISEKEILNRMNNQISDEERNKRSDFVIVNNTLNQTKNQVKTLCNLICN